MTDAGSEFPDRRCGTSKRMFRLRDIHVEWTFRLQHSL